MSPITNDLKEFIKKRCPKAHIRKTRHKSYVEMTDEVIRVIAEYEKYSRKRIDSV